MKIITNKLNYLMIHFTYYSFEFFEEPVTIKCGHKFCKNCILRVASTAKSSCPICKIKIQKRSIPKESNQLLQACVKQFHRLTQAIHDDSGIDGKF